MKKLTQQEFIDKAIKIHGDKYDYSLVNYINNNTKVKIICKKHGIFEQKPNNHLSNNGCPVCKESKGEKEISKILEEKSINYIAQYKFIDCVNKISLPFDFYLPDYNTCIEFDGIQHFKSIEYWGGSDGLKKRQNNDKIKNDYCLKNNIRLIRVKYNDDIKIKIKI